MIPPVLLVKIGKVMRFQIIYIKGKFEIRSTKYETNSKSKFLNVQNDYEKAISF